MAATVAVLGIGKMGAAITARLVDAGHPVRVWNRTPERALAVATSPDVTAHGDVRAAVGPAEVVVSILTDGRAVRSVLADGGVVAAMPPGSVLVELSTIDAESMAAVGRAGAEHGVAIVSGAMSGTPAVIARGAAAAVLSGPPAAIAAATPAIEAFTARIVTFGEDLAEAKLLKIGVNAFLAGTMELIAESVVLLEASGVARESFARALAGTVLRSAFTDYKVEALLARDYRPTFTTSDLRKDVLLAVAQGDRVGVPLPIATQMLDLLQAALDEGYGAHDFLSLVPRLQAASGAAPDDVGEVV
jgi:3-hydroxyisobutyrate dehydrogenase-like beta-hydroxyacid dehydrogenase